MRDLPSLYDLFSFSFLLTLLCCIALAYAVQWTTVLTRGMLIAQILSFVAASVGLLYQFSVQIEYPYEQVRDAAELWSTVYRDAEGSTAQLVPLCVVIVYASPAILLIALAGMAHGIRYRMRQQADATI